MGAAYSDTYCTTSPDSLDADVAGVGVRFGIYFEAFAVVIIVLGKIDKLSNEFESSTILILTIAAGILTNLIKQRFRQRRSLARPSSYLIHDLIRNHRITTSPKRPRIQSSSSYICAVIRNGQLPPPCRHQ
ncbi:hypothetical protein HDV00_012583 [Rhizophlyctis rosea]|nr:hypothetical protein HDV00_012583 [Rhizophlyctis rosea]